VKKNSCGESMFSKCCKIIGAIILFALMLTVPLSEGYAKSAKKSTVKRHSAKVVSHRSLQSPDRLVLRSASALVEDQRTGQYLIQKQSRAVVPIASITKLMTAMVVLDAESDLQEVLTIDNSDIDTLRHSRSRLPVGSEITRRDALLVALMASDNRAANALSRAYPGGMTACIAAMNAKARELGMSETRFRDSSGLSSENVSSARDLVRLVDAAYKYDLIRQFTTCKKETVYTGDRLIEFHNTNLLVQNPDWQIGLSKTGFIGEAGRCLVMQAYVANRPVLIVLLDSQGRLTRVGDANRIKKWLERPHNL